MLVVVVAFIAGCSRSGESPVLPKSEPVTVAMPLGLSGTLVILAREKRYFAEHGLDVTFKFTATSTDSLETVDRGEADIGMSSDTPFVFAVFDKKNVRLFGRVFRSRAFVSIVARKDRGIARPADLAGKRIGLVPGTAADYFSDLYLGFQGIKPSQFTRVALAVDQVESALQKGDVDAVAAWHPHNSRLIARLGPQVFEFSDPAVYQMRFDLVARPEFAGSRPEVAQKFLAALQDAQTFVRDNPEEAKRLMLNVTKEDPEILGRVWEECDYMVTLDQSLIGALEEQARWALGRRATARATVPNFLEFIDARPLKSVRPDAVSILLP
jgi:NitT/TauT family transport system substrate-binding protein